MKQSIYTWEKRREEGSSMPPDELLAEISDFITKRSNCSLATGYGTYIRNTPMRYSFTKGEFIFVTEGGYKFKGLMQNPNVCITIFDSENTSSATVGLTVEGTATVTEIYDSGRKVGESKRFIIKVTPTAYDYLNSNLPERGYYQLQRIDFLPS